MVRRGFLGGILGCIAAALPLENALARACFGGDSGLVRRLLPRSAAHARCIGRALLDGACGPIAMPTADPSRLDGDPDAVRRAIRRDYADGRVVQVDGWLVSETEYRLLLLAGRV